MNRKLAELLNLDQLKNLMEKFTIATKTGSAIVDIDGEVLVASGWQDICTKFHRVNPETCKNCIESDTILANGLQTGKKYNVYKCLNGLVDVAVPIIIANEHLGNLFIGQFLSEKPDVEFFRQQAKKYKFDEEKYIEALKRVPIFSDEEVKKKIAFLSEMANFFGEVGIKQLHLENLTKDLEKKVKSRTSRLEEAQIATLNMMRDVDEARQEAERANELLKQQQVQLKSMFDGIEDVIYVADPDSYELLYLNETGKRIWGKIYEGAKCYELLQGRKSPCPFCTNEQILKEPGKAMIWEFQNEVNKLWYRCFDKAIKWTSDKYVRFEMSIDINEIKDAQKAIIKEKEITDSVLNSIPGVFYQINSEGKFVRTNKNFQQLMGKTAKQMLATNALDLFEGEDKILIRDVIKEVFKNGFSEAEASMITKKGEIPFYFTGLLQKIESQPYLIGVGSDISKIKEAEKELKKSNLDLKESNEQLERFAYVASHDLQEPLRKIKSFSDLLARRIEDQLDEKTQKYLYYVTSGAVRMQRLINDLLQFSRISTRAKPYVKTNMNEIVIQALNRLSLQIKETETEFKIAVMPTILADETQIVSVIQNLINNAIKFRSDDTPQIKIDCKEEKNHWKFSIEDNGIGMEQQYQDRVFIIFQRLHNRSEYEGTGIGLAVCKKIVERHNGKIWFESEPGKGTTFYFTISKHLSENKK